MPAEMSRAAPQQCKDRDLAASILFFSFSVLTRLSFLNLTKQSSSKGSTEPYSTFNLKLVLLNDILTHRWAQHPTSSIHSSFLLFLPPFSLAWVKVKVMETALLTGQLVL